MSLAFYKKGQGTYTRVGTGMGTGILLVLGCYALYNKLEGLSLDPNVKPWVQAGIPALICLALAFYIFKVLNKPKVADFMIATEGEMKKVSWSTKKEIITSTKVVIVTVIIMAILLALVDTGFVQFFRWIGVLYVSPTDATL